MASRAVIQPVPEAPIDLIAVLRSVNLLRTQIAASVGENDGIDLALAKDGRSFDLTIHAKVTIDPARTIFILESQPIAGIRFEQVRTTSVPKALHRKLVVAKIVSREG